MADEEKSEEVTEEAVEVTAEETAPEETAPPEGAKTASAEEGGEEAAVQEKKSDKPRTAEDIFLELEGSDGEEKPKVVKAKGSKNIQSGVVHVSASFNNTIVSVSDASGNVIGWSSSGKMGFRGSRKSTAYAAQLVSQDACRQAMSHGLKQAEVRVKGPGAGRESAVRAVQGLGIDVIRIMDVTPVPHNGCRPKKARRV
ncbi:MAG: 30S ribosomal protein S11 [Verrucomicrobiales bacterium]|jgi:small subunit ribosomal protein S11|nr:30S ribosomal protein S11 [Verrucomicrobiales bacterium]|tara:strand:+ start:4286 stop:4882 length:597 start_codon:yes stop_codon:yes gene_type:complete